ncbi:YacP-like NYN domain-containing protein [Pavlovales sp. CCMP2436]|nr:YacP-like NYN domain-containing protein [Pavlovales sp. CCMP2436]
MVSVHLLVGLLLAGLPASLRGPPSQLPGLQSMGRPHALAPARSSAEPRDVRSRVDVSKAHGDGSLSVRMQIKLAKYFKALAGQDSTPDVRKTRFRKAKAAGGKGMADLDNSHLYSDAPTVIIVDGYNIIGQWPELKRLRDEGSMDRARDQLLARLADYACYMDWNAELVFDAAGNEERAACGNAVEVADKRVNVVWSSQAADTYIGEQARDLLENDLASSVFVSSADWAVQQNNRQQWRSANPACGRTQPVSRWH